MEIRRIVASVFGFFGVLWTQFTVSVSTDLITVETVLLLEWHRALGAICRDGELVAQLHG